MDQQQVFGIAVTSRGIDDLVDEIVRREEPARRVIFTMNLDHVVQMRRNPSFRDAYAAADVVTIDGAPVLAYAKARGAMVERITGADLFSRLMPRLDGSGHRLFFVLSSARLCDMMRERLAAFGFAPGQTGFAVPPFGFEHDLQASRQLAHAVRAFGPTHTFVCVGSPKSELWCARHPDALGQSAVLCVGASAEFYLGLKRRAPPAVQRLGLEGLWRWLQEPRRLFRRYFISSWGFCAAVLDDLRGRSRMA